MQDLTEQCLPLSRSVEQPLKQPKTFATHFIMNAKKPSNLRTQWLLTLPSRTSQSTFGRWSTFCDTQEMCPCFQREYTDSNAHKNIDNINDLANYYGNLENQEKKECNWENWLKSRTESQSTEKSQSVQQQKSLHWMKQWKLWPSSRWRQPS